MAKHPKKKINKHILALPNTFHLARDVTDVQPLAYHPEPRSEVRSEVPEALQLEIKPPTGSLGFCLGFWGSFWGSFWDH